MKKILKITGITILSIVIILVAVPFIFKGKINSVVKEQINNNLNAKVDYGDLGLDLITSFPNFKLTLKDLYVAGINEFEGDTLLKFKSLKIKLDLISVIKMEDIQIKAIILEEPGIYALVLPNGKANWDIAKPSADTAKADTSTAETRFSLKLKKFEIIRANIVYDDQQGKMYSSLQNFNFNLTGDFTQDFTSVNIVSNTDFANVVMDGVKYLKDAGLKFNITADADMKNSKYTLKDNTFSINDLELGWNGTVTMKDTNIIMDMTYLTKRADFKSILSLIPAIYMNDFETVKTSGTLKLDGYVRGTYNSKKMPNVGLTLLVDNAMFKYPDLPKSVDNISINTKIFFDGTQNDNTIIDINKFHFEISKNPFDIVLNLKTPMSDPAVNARLKGSLDLSSLKDVVPLDEVTIKGLLNMNIDMMGQMSMIEKEKYEEFKAAGSFRLERFEYLSKDVPKGTVINKAILLFSPKEVDLTAFDAVIGKSDIKMSGKLQNFIPYALKGETIKGTLVLSSNILDLNQFLAESEEQPQAEAAVDTAPLTIFEVPKNINFVMKSDIGQIYYDKLVIKNMAGTIKIIDGKVLLEKIKLNMLEGSMLMDCEYNTQDLTKPFVDLDLDIKHFDIPSSFVAFNTIKKLAPIAENAKGYFSMGLKFRSQLDKNMNPVLSSIVGEGDFSSESVEVMNSKTFSKIAEVTQNDKLKNVKLENVSFDFTIKDGRVYVDPFDTKIGKTKMNIMGDNGLDQSLSYVMKIAVPRAELGSAANAVVANLTASAASKGLNIKAGENVNFNVKIGNTIFDPKVTMDLLADNSAKDVKDQVKNQITNKIDDSKNKAKEAANKQAQKILADAQKQADQVKATAAQLAEATRKEGYANAAKIDQEAAGKPKFAKDVAKKLSDKTRKESDDKANKIISEANQKADALMNKAKADSDKLTK